MRKGVSGDLGSIIQTGSVSRGSRIVIRDPEGIPSDFYLLDSAPGVQLYRKDYPGGSPDYVQVVDLNQGASMKLLHGEIHDPRTGEGVYGGNDAKLVTRSLNHYWNGITSTYMLFVFQMGNFS